MTSPNKKLAKSNPALLPLTGKSIMNKMYGKGLKYPATLMLFKTKI
jgi:hypothetical protein